MSGGGGDQDRSSPLVMEAVLKAAEVAGVGIAVSVLEPSASRCVYATDTAARMLGTPLDGLVGHSLRDFIAPADLPRLFELAARMIARPDGSADVVEVTAVRPDGSGFELQLAYSPTSVGAQPAVISFLIDIGSLRQQERSVRETAQQLARIVENTPDAIVVSRRGTILEANPAAARMLGVGGDPALLLGKSLAGFLSAEDAQAMRDRQALVARGEDLGPPRVYTSIGTDGVTRQVEIASFSLEFQGEPANIAFGRDVTDRERLYRQLERSERLVALGTLAAGVAHEINNPLASLALNAEVLERALADGGRDARVRELGADALADVQRAVERMSAIVRDLKGFTRRGPQELGPVDVAAVVNNALRVASHAARHRATVRSTVGAVGPVYGNDGKLEQVLVNLIVNAVQAFEPTRSAGDCEVSLDVSAPDSGRVVIAVRDNAGGIPTELQQRIFDPFFTTKPVGVGTGLGLFVCHNLVKQMDGEITVESTPGQGTIMRVVLRAWAGSPRVSEPSAAVATGRKRRVLVIDDEPGICRSLELLLRDRHQVTVAQGGEEGLSVLARDPEFDAILCDLMMPGVSGLAVFERVAREHPGLERRMVFMTGGAFTEAARAFLDQHGNPRLQKPFTLEQLDAAIESALR